MIGRYTKKVYSKASSGAWLKICDTTTTPARGTGTPVKKIAIPAASTAANLGGDNILTGWTGFGLVNGIGYWVTGDFANSDTDRSHRLDHCHQHGLSLILCALLAVAAFAFAVPAYAGLLTTGVGGGEVSDASACPNASTAASDGCAQAPTDGSWIDRNFFYNVRMSGQAPYVALPAWNVAGVNYPVGYRTSVPLRDPATVSSWPSGCSYSAHGDGSHSPASQPAILCNGASSPTFNGLNLSSVGGHPCTVIVLMNSTSGTVTISNTYYKWDLSCVGGSYAGINGASYNLVFTNNTVDMQDDVPGGGSQTAVYFGTSGTMTFQYNAFLNSQCRIVGLISDGPTPGDVNVQFNMWSGFGYSCSDSGIHLESILVSGQPGIAYTQTMTNFNQSYNVVAMAQNWQGSMAGMISPFFFNNGTGGYNTVTNTTVNNNVLIGNAGALPSRSGARRTGGTQMIEIMHNYMTNVSISNNYYDPTNAGILALCSGAPDGNAGSLTPFTSVPVTSGNTNMLTGRVGAGIGYSPTCLRPSRSEKSIR
jgi:hypothetical protein